MGRALRAAGYWVCLFFPAAGALASGFNDPVQVGAGLGPASEAVIATDEAGDPVIAFSAGGRIYLTLGFDGFQTARLIGTDGDPSLVHDLPSVETDSMGVTYVAFREHNGMPLKDVAWTHNPGGQFKPPNLVPGSDHTGVGPPHIGLMAGGEIFIGWSSEAGAEDGSVYMSLGGGSAQAILSGNEATFGLDGNGIIHVAYARNGDIFYSNNDGADFSDNEVRLTSSSEREWAPQIAVSLQGSRFLSYVKGEGSKLDLYLTGGNWGSHQLVTGGLASPRCASLTSSPGGSTYVLAYAKGTTLWKQAGLLGFPATPAKVRDLQSPAAFVDLAYDRSGCFHVVYEGSGSIYYTNDAPKPKADFSVQPTSGQWPLEVTFEDRSTGHILDWHWDFGDGGKSLLASPKHVYDREGIYSVTLRVVGTAGVYDKIVREDLISVGPKTNHLYLPDVAIYAGQANVKIPIRATNDRELNGFQIAGVYDPARLSMPPHEELVDFEGTRCSRLDPEFVACSHDPENNPGAFAFVVLFDATLPITGKTLPPAEKMNLVNLILSGVFVSSDGEAASLRLENGVGDPPISNIFTVGGGFSVYPEIHNGVVRIYRAFSQGPIFLRGDANSDWTINMADGVFILAYLFARGAVPLCMDAADFDDSQSVNIGDAIAILSYLFRQMSPPAYPFPTYGLDPTPDALPPCVRN